MSGYAIRVENLGKQYRIGAYQGRYKSLRESLMRSMTAPVRRMLGRDGDTHRGSETTIWALKDVSFEVKHGEVVGIIGRNGAGKSTLLKLLARITEPTEGELRLRGRVGSLLEVGTGFHPELTGRENIFLNGAILGMTRREIQRKFDEIVDFAEIEKFIDTPAKHFSSGMYMRLAFAVAAHLEPEILLVDEVLAVGDAQFQKKCLGKMGEVAKTGRTVLFVSHNMGAILQLCPKAILFSDGRNILNDFTPNVVSSYLGSLRVNDVIRYEEKDLDSQIISMAITSLDGLLINISTHQQEFNVQIEYKIRNWNMGSYICLDVFNEYDVRILWACDVTTLDEMKVYRRPGLYKATIKIPGMVLSPGHYYFTAAIYNPTNGLLTEIKEKALSIEITDGGSFLSNFGIKPHSATMIPLPWKTELVNE